MNSIWNKNISVFSERFNTLKEFLKEPYENFIQNDGKELESIWQISTAKNGSLTATEGQFRLHSSYNPEREAEQAISKILETKPETIVFMGFGLGYHLASLAKALKERNLLGQIKVIVLEPNPLYFFASMYLVDWTSVFEIQQLVLAIACNPDSFIPLVENQKQINLGNNGVSNAFYFSLPAFTAHEQAYFDTIQALIQRNKSKNEINSATYEKFVKLWAKNSLKNLQEIQKHPTVNSYKKIWLSEQKNRNRNFLLVAAGPSLEKMLPQIHKFQNNITIVCVETALRALIRAGIQPDFIVITDPQFWAYKHIADLEAPESILVCPLSVYPAVFRFKCKEILLCSDMLPVSQFFESNWETFGDLGAGGSVASAAWNLCYLLGAQNIYLCGLDLSFPSKQTHIRGSSAEQTFYTISNKIHSVDGFSCNSMYSANPDYGTNYLDKKVLTDSRMKMFAWWFESRIAACPEVKTYSLCPESMKIPGVEVCTNYENFYHPSETSEIKSSVLEILNQLDKMSHENFQLLEQTYTANIKKLKQLINSGVENCIINDSQLKDKLASIEIEISKNPLAEIVRLGTPSQKYLESHKTNPAELALFQKLQKEIDFYFPTAD